MFYFQAGATAVFGQIAGIGVSIFTGYALFLGAKESQIGIISSVAAAASLVQVFSFYLTNRIERKKAFIVISGVVEILFRFAIIFLPILLVPNLRVPALFFLVFGGNVLGHLISPLFNSWFATLVPERIRAEYIGKRTIIVNLTQFIVAYAAGRFLDRVPGYTGFASLIAVASAAGILCYLILLRIPFPPMREVHSTNPIRNLTSPLKDRNFAPLVVFYISWIFALDIAGPFYNVFMIKNLRINYSTIAILANAQLVAMIVGYRLWGKVIDRFSAKTVLQILFVPVVVTPAMWVFNTPDRYFLLAFAMIFGGFAFSGIGLAISTLQLQLLPPGEDKAIFFASFASLTGLASFSAPIIGSILVSRFESVSFQILATPIGNLQIMFIISTMLRVVPLVLTGFLRDPKASAPSHFWSQILRGNPISYAITSFIFSRVRESEKKARIARIMGRSKSPMAVKRLADALKDLDPQVRSAAAEGLGETESAGALAPLIEELESPESDIRPQAVEALGRIRSDLAVEHLLKALWDENPQVVNSAIMALSEIGGEKAIDGLYKKLAGPFDLHRFPLLVNSLSRLGDLRIIPLAMEAIRRYKSPVVKRQLLNSVCWVLGAKGDFYNIILRDDLGQTDAMGQMLKQMRRIVKNNPIFDGEFRQSALSLVDEMAEGFEAESAEAVSHKALQLVDEVKAWLRREEPPTVSPDVEAIVGKASEALYAFLNLDCAGEFTFEGMVFPIICARQAILGIARWGKRDRSARRRRPSEVIFSPPPYPSDSRRPGGERG
ncbi:MAG: MFS transporter [bacterium]